VRGEGFFFFSLFVFGTLVIKVSVDLFVLIALYISFVCGQMDSDTSRNARITALLRRGS
jgi:hypothetical protein